MLRPRIIISLVASTALVACSTAQPPLRGTPNSATKIMYDTRLLAGECIFLPDGAVAAPLLGAIGAIFASELVGATVRTVGEELTKAGEEKTYTVSATRNIVLEEDKVIPCLHLVRGRFHLDPVQALAVTPSDIELEGYGDLQHKWFTENNLWLAEKPDLLIELVPIRDVSSIAFEIGYLAYQKPLAPGNASGRETVEILEMSLRPPGIPHNHEKAPAIQLLLGTLTPPFVYHPQNPDTFDVTPSLRPMQTPWLQIGSSAAVENRVLLTADVRVAETVPENPILKTLGAAFTNSADAVESTVKSSLDSASRASAEATEFNTAKTALTEYWTAFGNAETAITACKAAPAADKKAKATTARGAQELVNLLASRVGKKGYPAGELIDPSGTIPC